MSRPSRVLLSTGALAAVAAFATACGTQKITVPTSQSAAHRGAVLFSERCAGCHTLSYAATHGSSSNPRSAEITNGPNLDQRCERPVTRVLYAIENGGFSGAIMPQNVLVGQDAVDVAQFVSRYAGTKAARAPGVPTCASQSTGSLPSPSAVTASSTSSSGSTTTTANAKSTPQTKAKTKKRKKK